MIITKISASIRMSRQTDGGTWATVELSAEAAAVEQEDTPWQEIQAQLYRDLKAQLTELWNCPVKDRPANGKAPPANGANPTPEKGATPPNQRPDVDQRTGEITRCPDHDRAEPSEKGGGLYCPQKLPNGKYCPWTHGKPQRQTRRR